MARGKAMAAPDDPGFDAGTMMAVMGKVDSFEELLGDFPDLKVANFNSNKQVVVAGPKDQIEKAFDFFKSKRFSVVSLPVSAAFHTSLVGHAQKPFSEAIHKVKFNKPKVPVFSNQTAKAYPKEPEKLKKGSRIIYWSPFDSNNKLKTYTKQVPVFSLSLDPKMF